MIQFLSLLCVATLARDPSGLLAGQWADEVRANHHRSGALVICGGGRLPDAVYREFASLAGAAEARLVVIPTAGSGDPDESAIIKLWRDRGFDEVSILHTRDPSVANEEEFTSALGNATAVWISGGQQSRLAASYQGTLVETELLRLLERGGVIGGSSAGAAIMSRTMIAGGRAQPEISIGMDLLEGAIVDQHFLKRSRVNRLVQAVSSHPELTGYGIDESTALIVEKGEARVVGESYVVEISANEDSKMLFRIHSPGDTFEMGKPDR